MIPSKTTNSMKAVLEPIEDNQFRVTHTSSFLNTSQAYKKTTNIMTNEDFSAVLAEPISQTTPMVITEASSSPIMDHQKFEDPPYYGYVMIPVIAMLVLAVISGVVFYWMQRRKQLDSLRHRLIPVYNFAPGEEEEWGVLLDIDNDSKSSHPHDPS